MVSIFRYKIEFPNYFVEILIKFKLLRLLFLMSNKFISEKEIETEVKQIIDQINAEGMKDMGKVMGIATKNMLGKADGKIISTVVRKLLS